eukprot:2362752-Prymnesium_polylepis.1
MNSHAFVFLTLLTGPLRVSATPMPPASPTPPTPPPPSPPSPAPPSFPPPAFASVATFGFEGASLPAGWSNGVSGYAWSR